MRRFNHVEEAGTATNTEANASSSLLTGVYLVSFEITNKSTTVDLILKWGSTGEERIIKASSDGNTTWTQPIPKNGTMALVSTNVPRVKTAASTAAYLVTAYTHDTA